MSDRVLLIGSGGREHALAWKLAQSDRVQHVYVSPGNAGTANADNISNVALNVKDFAAVGTWCKENSIKLVVVGPEDPLANGISDSLKEQGIACFGPCAKAAEIEASKAFSKNFMEKYSIPTARYKVFTNSEEACAHINSADYRALVVKASGLAAGKGVIVAKDTAEACAAVRQILDDKSFGSAGEQVVVEELLDGPEVSCLAFSDGKTIACMPAAQDHKRLLVGDEGLNTGGMGAYCPCPLVSAADLELIKRDVLQKAVDGMREEGYPYIGVLYAGLMLTKDGPKTLEYNCRFGDPETQVLLPMLQSDLYATCLACVEGTLDAAMPRFHDDRSAVGVVLVSGGYPGSYKKGLEITGLNAVDQTENQMIFHAGTTLKDSKVVTSGGRVLAVVAMDTSLATAALQAQQGAAKVKFEGAYFRSDIAHRALKRKAGLTYRAAGVDIQAGERLVDAIKPMAAATTRAGCTGSLGMFGGIFDCKAAGFKDPLLVSGTDGVGTKLKIAQACSLHDTIGIDLVAMCVNDVLAHGAEPLFFLDYFACGKLDVGVAQAVVKGVADGCSIAGCALLGGETAEMPGMYAPGDYDVAGFAVGAVERELYLPHINEIVSGDVLIGLPSSGIHSNGYSLVRRIVEKSGLTLKSPCPFATAGGEMTLGQALLTPTKIYCRAVLPSMRQRKVKAFAHITGGGLIENIPRVLPEGAAVELDAACWPMLPVFGWLASVGGVEAREMATTFNCGIGGVLVVKETDADAVLDQLRADGEAPSIIGKVTEHSEGANKVEIRNLESALSSSYTPQQQLNNGHVNGQGQEVKVKVAVLISGSGTNLQALIDHTMDPKVESCAEITLVISNKAGVKGLERAEKAGIPTKVIKNKDYKSRLEFDNAMDGELRKAGVEVICLAGFMRILTGEFTRKWNGRLLNIHPSLLPSFKGMHAHQLVLEAGACISGCTVHYVAEEVDAGAIIAQESVPVYPADTEDTLAERVKTVEHKAYPHALELVASGRAKLGANNKIQWSL